MTRHWTRWLGAGSIVLLASVGCTSRNTSTNLAAGTGAPAAGKTTAQKLAGQKSAAPAPKMTKSQTLGVDIVTAFSRNPTLKDARISVGTTSDTVTLNGTVANPQQSQLAASVARQKAPGYKLVNQLKVGATATPKGKKPR